jgi:hypothetical protein
LRKRVEEYLAQANAHYNPLGINFRLEKGYRRWYLVIDIMPQYSSAAGPSTSTLPQGGPRPPSFHLSSLARALLLLLFRFTDVWLIMMGAQMSTASRRP